MAIQTPASLFRQMQLCVSSISWRVCQKFSAGRGVVHVCRFFLVRSIDILVLHAVGIAFSDSRQI
jgi:hypothetical protein